MLPYTSRGLPGVKGRVALADCTCEEVLRHQPAQTGDHWWVKAVKTNLGTGQARDAIARSVNVDPELVACAGRRDRQGHCTQWFSLPAAAVDHPGPLRRAGCHGKLRVLELTASHKPVTPALVARLRWSARLHDAAQEDGYRKARQVLDALRLGGCPNYVAPSRLGESGNLAKWGRLLLQGRHLPPAVLSTGISKARCLRACQEWLFNRYLARRVEDGLLATCLPGDVMLTSLGTQETVSDPAHAQRRMDSWEAVPLGPLFGADLPPAAEADLTEEQLGCLRGSRRAIRFQPTKALIDIDGADLILTCELPTDASIAVLLEEFVKPEQHLA